MIDLRMVSKEIYKTKVQTDIAESNIEVKLQAHPSNDSLSQVRAVHQADTIHDAARHDEAMVDAVDNLPLLSWSEL